MGKCLDLLSNFLNSFMKETYRDQFGEFYTQLIPSPCGSNIKKTMGWGFCDIQNNRILGKWLSAKPEGKADNTYRDRISQKPNLIILFYYIHCFEENTTNTLG